MTCSVSDISNIIKNNPGKDVINEGINKAQKLLLHVHGYGLDNHIKRHDYFESESIFKERKNSTISNKDLFARVLQSEDMVFTAQGGATYYAGLSDKDITALDDKLSNLRFNLSLRKWIKTFALEAYRCDPAGVIFIEINDRKECYPTYKCISSIYDYKTNGRALEYIVFKLTVAEVFEFGIDDQELNNKKPSDSSPYYRFIDDANDYIVKYSQNVVSIIDKKTIKNFWGKVPGFIVSDIINFDNAQKFGSPLDKCIELADCFLNDRSTRDLQKKHHGFAKAIEPLLKCVTCDGTGYHSGAACPDCTPAGGDHGTGYKLHTKVSDVARFPIGDGNFNPASFFAYIQPAIDTWNKQDSSLNDLEVEIKNVYWGTDERPRTTGPGQNQSLEETATKTLANLQPKYARLNMTADWAESTENLIVNFIAKYYFSSFKKSSITYGRYYILETPYELMEQYLDMKSKGASQFALTDALKKYYHSLYQTNPVQLAIKLKLINVEPFVHLTAKDVKDLGLTPIDYTAKLYFSEWLSKKVDNVIMTTKESDLVTDLYKFASEKLSLLQSNESELLNKQEKQLSEN